MRTSASVELEVNSRRVPAHRHHPGGAHCSPTLSPIMITITQGERNERGQAPVKT